MNLPWELSGFTEEGSANCRSPRSLGRGRGRDREKENAAIRCVSEFAVLTARMKQERRREEEEEAKERRSAEREEKEEKGEEKRTESTDDRLVTTGRDVMRCVIRFEEGWAGGKLGMGQIAASALLLFS